MTNAVNGMYHSDALPRKENNYNKTKGIYTEKELDVQKVQPNLYIHDDPKTLMRI